jgi:hypothetical protein
MRADFQHERLGGERLRNDAHWKYGAPPVGTSFAWVEHMIHHLATAFREQIEEQIENRIPWNRVENRETRCM